MMQVGFSKKYSKRRRTYPATSEAGPAEHDKAEFIIGTNKTSHGFLEFAESEVDMGLAPQFKEFALEECKGSTGLVLMSVANDWHAQQQGTNANYDSEPSKAMRYGLRRC